jgi:hypothetical protein
MTKEIEIDFRIILESPTSGVDFGLQKGGGNTYETVQKKHSNGDNLTFEFPLRVKLVGGEPPNFLGHFAQGTRSERFVYIDIGKNAGQIFSQWSRRLKVPLKGITNEMIGEVERGNNMMFETRVAGTGRDGGPNCATVKPFAGWKIVKS